MPEKTYDVQDYACSRVRAGDDHQSVFRESPNDADQQADQDDRQRGLLTRPRNIFETVVANGAGHQRTQDPRKRKPSHGPPPIMQRKFESVYE